MADRDERADQAPGDDVETVPGASPTGSDTGSQAPGPLPERDPETPPELDPDAGGPPTEVDGDSLNEGLQPGAGGSGGGGLFDPIGDALEDLEDVVVDAGEEVDESLDTGVQKVYDGAASLADDVQHEAYEEWKDAGHDQGGFEEHQGGWFADPYGTIAAPFRAADQAYDGVEDDIAGVIDRSGIEEVYDDAEDAVNDLTEDVPVEDLALTFGTGTLGAAYGAGRVLDETGLLWEAEGVAYETAFEVADAVDGPHGGSSGGASDTDEPEPPPDEPADPLAAVEDTSWDAAEPVAEQAGAEEVQAIPEPGPVDLPIDPV
jgi:hypothetical protein